MTDYASIILRRIAVQKHAGIIGINTRTFGNNRHSLQYDIMFETGMHVIGNYGF